MENKKITDLAELTAVASDDYLEIVDTSAHTSKKISRENLIGGGGWQDWTPTVTGWAAGTIAGIFRYCKIGNLVNCIIAITAGTSNGVTAVLSLPVQPAASSNVARGTWGWGQDAGIQVNPAGGWVIGSADGGTISFFKTSIDGAGWTSSGTKRIYCMFFYEVA